MENERFRQAITNGLGRAVLWLRQHPWGQHAEAIENACLHNTAYDPQCEGSRAEYVYEIIAQTDNQRGFADIAISGLFQTRQFWDVYHLYHLVRLFAQGGNDRARTAMYEKFTLDDAEEHFQGAEQIVTLDGIQGLLFVMDGIGQWMQSNPDYWVDDELIRQAEKELGEQAGTAVSEGVRTNSNIRRFVEGVEKYRNASSHRHPPEYRSWTYPQLREKIIANQGEVPRGWMFGWGRHAPEDALREAAADLLKESDQRVLTAYLRIFGRRPFPLDPLRLIELAAPDGGDVATAARRALGQLQHDDIRTLALELIAQGRADSDIADLLKKNYLKGDHTLLESLLSKQNGEDDFHWMAHSTVDVFEANPEADAAASMLQIYEKIRCSICRMGAVKILIRHQNAPPWMLAECQHDSNPDIRELVRA